MTTSNANKVTRERSALDARRGVSAPSPEPHCTTKYSALQLQAGGLQSLRAPCCVSSNSSPLQNGHCPGSADGVRRVGARKSSSPLVEQSTGANMNKTNVDKTEKRCCAQCRAPGQCVQPRQSCRASNSAERAAGWRTSSLACAIRRVNQRAGKPQCRNSRRSCASARVCVSAKLSVKL